MKQKYNRIIFFAKISIPTNSVLAVGKFVAGIVTGSFFLCMNAFYNLGIGIAKFISLRGHYSSCSRKEQYSCYSFVGIILAVASFSYMIYSIRMLVGETMNDYPQILAIAIAAVTFTELILSIQGSISTRRDREPILEAIKLTNFASSLISLVLTQTALLSFTVEGDASNYVGLSGILFGGCAAIIGVYMVIRVRYLSSEHYRSSQLKRSERLIAQIDESVRFEILRLDDSSVSGVRLFVRFPESVSEETLEKIRSAFEDRLDLELIRTE